jgi:alanine racemase
MDQSSKVSHIRFSDNFCESMPSCWVEVNLDAIRHNFRAIRHLLGDGIAIIAVIKANAYGHGALGVARALTAEGAPYLAVTRLDEALPLRASGLLTPILLLTPALPDELDEVVARQLTACLASYEDAARLSATASRRGITARAHLKINTGMGRLGVEPDEAVEIAERITRLPHIRLEAAFTHFAYASERDPAATHEQFARFQPLVSAIAGVAGISPTAFHCVNSAALLRFPTMRLSCVRPGTILYGQYPSAVAAEAAQTQHVELREAFSVKARVLAIRSLQTGQSVGYGGEWKASRPSCIATIAVGYADGLTQEPHARTATSGTALKNTLRQAAKQAAQATGLKSGDASRSALLKGRHAPIVGRIAMQQCSIDITHLEGVEVGDEVTVSMRRTSAGAHLPRIYTHDNVAQ